MYCNLSQQNLHCGTITCNYKTIMSQIVPHVNTKLWRELPYKFQVKSELSYCVCVYVMVLV